MVKTELQMFVCIGHIFAVPLLSHSTTEHNQYIITETYNYNLIIGFRLWFDMLIPIVYTIIKKTNKQGIALQRVGGWGYHFIKSTGRYRREAIQKNYEE